MRDTRTDNVKRRARGTCREMLFSAGSALFVVATLTLQAQPPTQGGRGGRGGTITSPRNAYPDRPPGDPAAIERGKALYGVNCQFCHGADTRGSGGGRGGPPPVTVPPTTVTLTLPSGEKVEGKLDRLDDFVVSLTTADGTHRSFRTPMSGGDAPKVEVHDPLQPHKDLLRVYTDADIHNVTAFLVTLK